MNKKQKKQLLAKWQERLALAKQEHDRLYGEAADRREQIYRGERTKIDPVIEDDGVVRTGHVRNIAMELIESMVSTTVPIPKVRARRKEDEGRARLIEDMLRAELDRMNTEELIDLAERTVPIQGGCGWLVEWDPCSGTHAQKGDVCLSLLHPKLIYPQPGIYTDVADMEWLILAVPQTRGYLARRYGVELDAGDATEDPSLRGVGEESEENEELCTQYIAYFKNENGGIGLFSWGEIRFCRRLRNTRRPFQNGAKNAVQSKMRRSCRCKLRLWTGPIRKMRERGRSRHRGAANIAAVTR